MSKKLLIMQLVFILVICINEMALAFTITKTPDTVNSAEVFDFSMDMDARIYLANGHLIYDPQLFEFVSCSVPNLDLRENTKGDISWIYVDNINAPTGITNIKFNFKAKSVASNMTSYIEVKDSIYIDTNEQVYENANFVHPITILGKEPLDIPATGGIGKYIFFGGGVAIIVGGILYLKKSE